MLHTLKAIEIPALDNGIHHPITSDNIDHWERSMLAKLETAASDVRNHASDLRHHLEGIQYLLNQLELASAAANFNHNKGVSQ